MDSKQNHGLDFEVDTLVCMGSPLGVFLSLRECKIAPTPGPHHVYPRVRKMYNINHPADPVAYRLEPFIARSVHLRARTGSLERLGGGGGGPPRQAAESRWLA